MTREEMTLILHRMADQYETNTGHLAPDSLREMADDYGRVYHWFLRGRPLAGIIERMEIRPDREESKQLADELKTPEDFIIEFENLLVDLHKECGIIQSTAMARLERLQVVARHLATRNKQ